MTSIADARAVVVEVGKLAGARMGVGLHRLLGDRAGGRAGVLLYHRVVEHTGAVPPDSVTPQAFRSQLEGLARRGFRFTRVDELLRAAGAGERLPPRSVVVTFDDGFAGVRDHAFPVLADLGVPATVFAATAFIGTSTPFPFDPWGARHAATTPPSLWRPLDWPACREMEASGLVSIGSHTHTHRDLRSDPLEFERDVSTSLAVLDEQLGSRARALAYPFGSVADGFAGPELARAARRAGATCGFTTEYELVDLSSDRFRWGRFECVESDDGATCAAKLAGWYAWMGGVRRGFQRVSSR